MKLKANKNLIFTLNQTLKKTSFDEEIEVQIKSVCGVFLGRESSNKEFEHIQLEYKAESVNELKYLYHVKILGAGLKYKHMAYVKATWFQHIQIWFVNRFMKFITNFENIFKILTVMGFTIPFFLNNNSNVNVYISNPKTNIINTDSIIDKVKCSDTTEIILDSVLIKQNNKQ